MSFFEKIWKRKKEIGTAAAITTGVLIHTSEAAAQPTPAEQAKTDSSKIIVSERGAPSATVNVQEILNEKSQYDLMVKLAGGDENLVKKELENYSVDGKVDTTMVLELFQIYDKLLKDNKAVLDKLGQSAQGDAADEEEQVSSRRSRRSVVLLTAEQALLKAREIMQNGEGQVFLGRAQAAEPVETPTVRATRRAEEQQATAEQRQLDMERARRELPDNLYGCLASKIYLKMLKGQNDAANYEKKKSEYQIALDNLINEIGNKIKAKGKVSMAEAGRIIINLAGQKGVDINLEAVATAVDYLAVSGFIDGYKGPSK